MQISDESRRSWYGISINERCEIILKFKDLVKEERYDLAKLLTNETGKNIVDAQEEIDNLIDLSTAFVEKARHLYGDLIPAGVTNKNNNTIQMTSRAPIGIVGVILPCNFPVLCFAHKVPPALLMGNTVIVKPSSKAPLTVIKLVYLLRMAGVPSGVIQLVNGNGETAGHALAMHPDLQLIYCYWY